MLKELWVTIHVYLLKGNPLTMEVGSVTWPLVQMGCFKPKEGQLPQNKPGPQSVAAEHASRIWELTLMKEREQRSGTRRKMMALAGAGALHFERWFGECDEHMAGSGSFAGCGT